MKEFHTNFVLYYPFAVDSCTIVLNKKCNKWFPLSAKSATISCHAAALGDSFIEFLCH